MKFACRSLISALRPTDAEFPSGLPVRSKSPARWPRGVFRRCIPRRLGTERLDRFLGDPILFEDLRNRVGIAGNQFEFGFNNQKIGQIAFGDSRMIELVLSSNDTFAQAESGR